MCKGTTKFQDEQTKLEFSSLFDIEKKVEVSYTATDMTNLGGLPVLRRVMQSDDFLTRLSRKIHDWRNPKLIENTLEEQVTQRVLQIASGYEDADDCDLLRHDSMLKLSTGRLPSDGDLCSQPTMTRLENHVGARELYAIGELFLRHFVESYDKEPDKIILDLDDSNADTYGAQQLTLFNTFYGGYCYMPLFIFEGISGKMVLPLLRPGRTNKRTNVFRLLRRIILFLRRHWKHTRIVVRGDSMFCSHEFMEWAHTQKGIHFITGLSGNSRLFERVGAWVQDVEERYARDGQDIREYHRFIYRADKWNRAQWVVVKIERNALGENVRFIVTDMYWHTPEHLFAGHETLATATILTFRKRIILQTARITELKTKIKIEFQRDNPMKAEILLALTAA